MPGCGAIFNREVYVKTFYSTLEKSAAVRIRTAMEKGTPIERTWVCITFEGDAVIGGDGQALDLYSGDLIAFDNTTYSHMATDNDLAMLQRVSRISAYDSRYVYLNNLPDRKLPSD